jgi:hypothetical protein
MPTGQIRSPGQGDLDAFIDVLQFEWLEKNAIHASLPHSLLYNLSSDPVIMITGVFGEELLMLEARVKPSIPGI